MNWDAILTIWAVLGPLAAAAISAIWARRNQLEDRKHEAEQRRITRQQDLEDREREFSRNTSTTKKAELRSSLSQFVAASNNYLELCQNQNDVQPSPEATSLRLDALAQINAHYQTVNLLGTNEIAVLSKHILNLATDYPFSIAGETPEKKEEHHRAYLQAKNALSEKARQLLGLESEA